MSDLIAVDRLNLPDQLRSAFVDKVVDILSSGGGPVRFVGGCVRDTILDKEVRDIDIATQEEPGKVMRLLESADIKAIPSGFTHGTVTAISEGQVLEITSLRKDVQTDGRWARVQFSQDWYADAMRRDFTINALYCDPDGTLYDPVQGREDIEAQRVRFIGKAQSRISEDSLRILRFYRFFAWYGAADADREALIACQRAAPTLKKIAGERLWQELSRLLLAPDSRRSLQLMSDTGIFSSIFPDICATNLDVKAVFKIARLEDSLGQPPEPIRRLAALLYSACDKKQERAMLSFTSSKRLTLSNKERDRLHNLLTLPIDVGGDFSIDQNRAKFYLLGNSQAYSDIVLLRQVLAGAKGPEWHDAFRIPWEHPPPKFPIGGADVMAMGIEAGPNVGRILKQLEDGWVKGNFVDNRESLLEKLKTRLEIRSI
mgnify:FL=1